MNARAPSCCAEYGLASAAGDNKSYYEAPILGDTWAA